MFNHYVAVDWAMSNMAIARITEKSNKITTIDVPSDIKELRIYLQNLKGKICLTIEETTTSQWLYTELKDCVDKIVICDPYRNKLLSEGAKTDKIDAEKLVKLLKGDLLKEVFHSGDKFIELRKIVSAYEDTIKAGVRFKNQRSALFRAYNKNHKEEVELAGYVDTFVLKGLDLQITNYENERKRYQDEFNRLRRAHPEIKRVSDIPGIGDIGAVKIISRVVDANRFPTRNNFLSYCGLIKLEKISGGKSYGKKNPRYCRMMKSIFKTGALATIDGNNQFGVQYKYLMDHKECSEREARSAIARQIATVTYGVMKSNKRYDPLMNTKSRREKLNDVSTSIDL
jgi:transposase